MGRAGWVDEVMRFYDRFVKGLSASQAPTDKDPKIAVETSDGTWRAETSWPPSDSKLYTSTLRPGTYVDNGQNNGELADANTGLEPTGDGVWTFSKPLPYAAHLSGVPKVTLDVTAQVGNGNLVADVYDVDAANNATLISRNAFLLGGARQTVSFPLYGDDWKLAAGHRISVLVTSSNSDWWAHVPTAQTITVNGGSISLPFPGDGPDQDDPGRTVGAASSTRRTRRSRSTRRPSRPTSRPRSCCHPSQKSDLGTRDALRFLSDGRPRSRPTAWRASPRAPFQHPADRAATAALKQVPYLDAVVGKLMELGYERALRQASLGSRSAWARSSCPTTGCCTARSSTCWTSPRSPTST